MAFSIAGAEGKQILKLAGAITIRHAQDLAARLGENLQDGLPLVVETAGLEDIDTCILQLLYSLCKTVPALSFDNPSDAFLNAVDRCGLRRDLLGGREDL
jgi:anti-anti-sigma regulatory factor